MFTFCFHVLSQLLLKKCSLSAAYMRAVCFHNTGTRQIQTQGTPFTADFCFVEGLQCYHHSVPELSTYSKKKKNLHVPSHTSSSQYSCLSGKLCYGNSLYYCLSVYVHKNTELKCKSLIYMAFFIYFDNNTLVT